MAAFGQAIVRPIKKPIDLRCLCTFLNTRVSQVPWMAITGDHIFRGTWIWALISDAWYSTPNTQNITPSHNTHFSLSWHDTHNSSLMISYTLTSQTLCGRRSSLSQVTVKITDTKKAWRRLNLRSTKKDVRIKDRRRSESAKTFFDNATGCQQLQQNLQNICHNDPSSMLDSHSFH